MFIEYTQGNKNSFVGFGYNQLSIDKLKLYAMGHIAQCS